MDDIIELKCSRCKEYKLLDEFYIDHRSGKNRHGRSYTCRYCASESRLGNNIEEWRRLHLEDLKIIFQQLGYDISEMDTDSKSIHRQFMEKNKDIFEKEIPKKLKDMTPEEKREYWNQKRYNQILNDRKKNQK